MFCARPGHELCSTQLPGAPSSYSTLGMSPRRRAMQWPCARNCCGHVFFFFKFICLFIYFWLCWVFASVRGLSLVAASAGHSSLRCTGLSLSWPLLLQSTGSRCAGSVFVAHGPSCSAACGILPDQSSNPCPLHWQADSQPLCHQGSPLVIYFNSLILTTILFFYIFIGV